MANIPQKVSERLAITIKKYQPILQEAKDKDKNEADTVTIISNMLHEVFGYDQYKEITREYAIKSTFCDLAIKVDDSVKFLIEVKAIGSKLNVSHINQATQYGANVGIEWVVLTNGIHWIFYKMNYGSKIMHQQISEIDFLSLKPKSTSDHDLLFILCKEGLKKAAIEEYHEYKKIVNKYYIGSIILSESIIDVICRELKKTSPGLKIDTTEIEYILKNDVLKRELVEDDQALEAMEQYKQVLKKAKKAMDKRAQIQKTKGVIDTVVESVINEDENFKSSGDAIVESESNENL